MTNFLARMGEEKLAKIRKWFFLGVAILGVILTAVTAMIPYLDYITVVGFFGNNVCPKCGRVHIEGR